MTKEYNSHWRCPSNIAIVKYWGKKEHQIPCNASLSLTLSASFTELKARLEEKPAGKSVSLAYYFENERNALFELRVKTYLDKHIDAFPFLLTHHLTLESTNSFPHSTGIASSASAFGALALVLCDFFEQTQGSQISSNWLQTASSFARLGSGSACRSLYPEWSQWGNGEAAFGNDLFAEPIEDVHPDFQNMRDAILVVDAEPKKVSSTAGHALMNNHPYASERFLQANNRVNELREILKNGNLDAFVKLTESEALTLHAMMMTSKDYYLLMRPNTITVIEKIFAFREQSGVPMCFTLDAGPNIHLLYPDKYREEAENFIERQLTASVKSVIFDRAGKGPEKLI